MMFEELDASLKMRLPLSMSTAVVFLAVIVAWVDQTIDLVALLKMTRLPSSEMMSSEWPIIGSSLFATHIGVNLDTFANHVPRYQCLGICREDYLLPRWKKPSANFLLGETSLASLRVFHRLRSNLLLENMKGYPGRRGGM